MDTKMNLNGLAVVLLALLCLAGQKLSKPKSDVIMNVLDGRTYFGVDERYNATLRDDNITEKLVQPVGHQEPALRIQSKGLTPRRSGWRAASDGGRYAASCCRALRCPPTPRSQQPSTRGQPRGRLGRESDRKTRVGRPSHSPGAPAPTRWA